MSRYNALYRDLTLTVKPCARAADRVVPTLGHIVVATKTMSWPSPAVSWPSLPGHAHPVSQYSPLYCDSHKEEMGSSSPAPPPPPALSPFFFHTIFFPSFQLLEIPQKKNIFFFIFSKPNKFIKIYLFFIFFSSFTHCKTLEKKFLHINFFFHLILDYLPKIIEHLRLYFSALVFNVFPMLFTKHTVHIIHTTYDHSFHITYNSCYTHHHTSNTMQVVF